MQFNTFPTSQKKKKKNLTLFPTLASMFNLIQHVKLSSSLGTEEKAFA
jgi:hypothetical protein